MLANDTLPKEYRRKNRFMCCACFFARYSPPSPLVPACCSHCCFFVATIMIPLSSLSLCRVTPLCPIFCFSWFVKWRKETRRELKVLTHTVVHLLIPSHVRIDWLLLSFLPTRALGMFVQVHNVNPESGPYPAVLLTTGTHRVKEG